MELSTRYEPQATEADIYQRWLDSHCFRATPDDRQPYCVVVPPPNVTGALHMGHALNHTIMDTLGRYKRMSGFNVLILPGTDHAGIATQSVVERQIAGEGLSRHDLGREAFVERVWQWKEEYGGRIVGQLKRLGCGYDWDRLRFTMDTPYVDAIMAAFSRMYADGLIYLGDRIVNWCPFHQTAISDIEVNHEEEQSFLYHIRYPFADPSLGDLTVATTRPETLLGDTAVAVNPKDERYTGKIGAMLKLPLTDREIPLIADEHAQAEFGTGAVKITPAHDPNDFEVGQRHHLPSITVIGPDGAMNARAGAYAGRDRFKAREQILADLEAQGLLVAKEPHTKSVGRCDRCNTVVEPLLSKQWFCKMGGTPMIAKAIRAASDGDVNFLPSRYSEMFVRWLENIRDWPISRQLWWGHRMPLWRKTSSDAGAQTSFVVARNREEAEGKLHSTDIVQVEDVLDTWFSSALWPFATLGWPSDSEACRRDLAYYYPTAALFTAQEILYLWVARMVMTGEEFLGQKPFGDVYVHATILDKQGQRMSKSKGNGVDPVDLINLYGADALRYALMSRAGQVQDIRIRPIEDGRQEQLEQARNFANKIWNASRFALMNLGEYTPPQDDPTPSALVDRWILSRLDETAQTMARAFDSYNMDEAARAIYEFFWDEFCDWYIEAAKPRLASGEEDTKHVLWFVLERSLRLLHPIMPYLSEAIWQNLPGAKSHARSEFLMFTAFPSVLGLRDEAAENEWALVQEITRSIRNLQAENSLKKSGPAYFTPADEAASATATANAPLIEFLTRFAPLTFDAAPDGSLLAPTRFGDVRLPRPQASPEEIAAERTRIEKELAKADKDLAGLNGRLNNEQFVASAPAAVVEKARGQAAELADRIAKLIERLGTLGAGG